MILAPKNHWNDYAREALAEKCFSETHRLTYPLISAQTELSELESATQAYVDRVKRLRLTARTRKLREDDEQAYAHICDELGDVMWAMTALYAACDGNMGLLPGDSFRVSESLALETLRRHNGVEPLLLQYCEDIRHNLIPIADAVCKSLRVGSEYTARDIGKLRDVFFVNIFKSMVLMAVALDRHVHELMNEQLAKVTERKKAGTFHPHEELVAVS